MNEHLSRIRHTTSLLDPQKGMMEPKGAASANVLGVSAPFVLGEDDGRIRNSLRWYFQLFSLGLNGRLNSLEGRRHVIVQDVSHHGVIAEDVRNPTLAGIL